MYTPSSSPELAVTTISAHHHATKRELLGHYGLRPLLAFFSHRVVRSGPRILFYLALFLSSVALVTKCLPLGLPDLSVVAGSGGRLWRLRPGASPDDISSANSSAAAAPSITHGGLRVVVFGENDVATSRLKPIPGVDLGDNSGTSWTNVLCSELACTSYLSFTPELEPPQVSLTSNRLYELTMKDIVEKSQNATPADDYSFLASEYPPRWNAPDLAAQISAFLSGPKPLATPAETIWVLSFGFWDIWSLSAYPYSTAEGLVSSFAAEVFYNVENLFAAAQDNTSVAYSDYRFASTDRKEDRLPWDKPLSEPFRVLIPLLFDPSLIPAWHEQRPEAPLLHTKPEQLRNAVRLTKAWNDAIKFEMETWVQKNAELAINGVEVELNADHMPDVPSKQRRDADAGPESPTTVSAPASASSAFPLASSAAETSQAPPRDGLWRDATIFRPSEYIMDAIIDGQMKGLGVMDKKGFGTFTQSESYAEVRRPCITSESAEPVHSPTPSMATDSIGLHKRKMTEEPLYVCDTPSDYLFLTAYNLGRRAIEEVGRLAAAVVRRDQAARLKSEGRNGADSDRNPGSWKEYFDLS